MKRAGSVGAPRAPESNGAARARIRRARARDAPALARVMRAAIRGVPRGLYPARTLAAWASLPALYHAWAMTAGGETVLLAEAPSSVSPGGLREGVARGGGGRVVGYAGLRGAELTALFVLPWAARRGFASALLARVEALARRRGVRTLRVDAARSGVAFYRARGFTGGRTVRVPLPGATLAASTRRLRAASSARPCSSRRARPGARGGRRGSAPRPAGPSGSAARRRRRSPTRSGTG